MTDEALRAPEATHPVSLLAGVRGDPAGPEMVVIRGDLGLRIGGANIDRFYGKLHLVLGRSA